MALTTFSHLSSLLSYKACPAGMTLHTDVEVAENLEQKRKTSVDWNNMPLDLLFEASHSLWSHATLLRDTI